LNRFLAQAIDVTPLASPTVENNSPSSAASHERTESQPVQNPKLTAGEQPLPVLNTVADLPAVGPSVGELTIECSVRGARIYIDGSYSGVAPRTLRLRAGFHTILVVSYRYKTREQRLLIPGAKISVVRAELQR